MSGHSQKSPTPTTAPATPSLLSPGPYLTLDPEFDLDYGLLGNEGMLDRVGTPEPTIRGEEGILEGVASRRPVIDTGTEGRLPDGPATSKGRAPGAVDPGVRPPVIEAPSRPAQQDSAKPTVLGGEPSKLWKKLRSR
ncbi:MAG: hypothetical protein ABMB14_07445 [Myxococcota bacterium]